MRLSEARSFFARVHMPIDWFACWTWKLTLFSGYGRFCYNKTTRMAHRASYELTYGIINSSLDIDHLCRNRACVNPLHLEQVTRAENVLRGEGVAARRSRQTACSRGHKLLGDNLKVYSQGPNRAPARVCKTCENAKQRRRNRRASK